MLVREAQRPLRDTDPPLTLRPLCKITQPLGGNSLVRDSFLNEKGPLLHSKGATGLSGGRKGPAPDRQ